MGIFFILKVFRFIYVYECFACMCIMYKPGACGEEKKASKLEFQTVVSQHVGAGNQTSI